jgi:hypothetical protein
MEEEGTGEKMGRREDKEIERRMEEREEKGG